MKKPFLGILAFLIVLFTMPLGHAVMVLMENLLGHAYVFVAAGCLGFAGVAMLICGILSVNKVRSTFWGLFAGLFIWTGWVEFSFVYFADRLNIAPLVEAGKVVTKPEYLIMPSSLPFLLIFLIYYVFNSKTGCAFFSWIQKQGKVNKLMKIKPVKHHVALTTMMEVVMLLWTFYLVLLFAYDSAFFGDRHLVTYAIAFGSLFWSLYLFLKLLRISSLSYAVRYAIPTVIIFWNFVEILGRWNLFSEIWIQPAKYWLELTLIAFVLVVLVCLSLMQKSKRVGKII